MIGIVLWSDPEECKAVFWCEDQGDLAYYDSANCADNVGHNRFRAGDMVQFEVSAENRMRIAHAPKLLQEQVCTELPDTLRRSTQPAPASAPQSARVIPFEARDRKPVDADLSARKA